MAAIQPDLFAAPQPAGLAIRDAFVRPAEERALIEAIDGVALAPFRFQQWLGKRLTASFGWDYDFTRGRLSPAEPMPPFLLALRERAAAFAGIDAGALVHALLIRYDPGAGIGWHRDRPAFDHVVGISLGAPATLRLRRARPTGKGYERTNIELPPRSAYHLSGEARHVWEHSIRPMDETRWSITFRSLS